jgi:hypothetical protein
METTNFVLKLAIGISLLLVITFSVGLFKVHEGVCYFFIIIGLFVSFIAVTIFIGAICIIEAADPDNQAFEAPEPNSQHLKLLILTIKQKYLLKQQD